MIILIINVHSAMEECKNALLDHGKKLLKTKSKRKIGEEEISYMVEHCQHPNDEVAKEMWDEVRYVLEEKLDENLLKLSRETIVGSPVFEHLIYTLATGKFHDSFLGKADDWEKIKGCPVLEYVIRAWK
jgi:hypothetical protein